MVYVSDLLTATAASVAGTPTPVRSWQWLRDGSPISGATDATYTVAEADIGASITVQQTETNLLGIDTATSAGTSAVLAFEPAALFQSGEEGAWYDPSDLSTLYQDAAGTTPVTGTGQPVGRIEDKSGNGNHATQATSTARPTLQSSGGLYYLDFDGVDDTLSTTFASAQAQPNSIGVGFKFDAYEAAGDADFVYDGVTGARHYLFNTASNIYAGAQNGVNYLVVASDLIDKVSLCSYNTTSSSTRINGVVSGGTGNVGTDNWGGISLGAWANGTSYKLDGRIYSFVGVNRALDAAEITSVETYLAAKSGVTL